jgi:hypothetical protein
VTVFRWIDWGGSFVFDRLDGPAVFGFVLQSLERDRAILQWFGADTTIFTVAYDDRLCCLVLPLLLLH